MIFSHSSNPYFRLSLKPTPHTVTSGFPFWYR